MVYNDINDLIQTCIFYQEKTHLYFFQLSPRKTLEAGKSQSLIK